MIDQLPVYSSYVAITCSLLKMQEILIALQGIIGFAFHWLKNLHEIFKPISKHRNCKHVMTFHSY